MTSREASGRARKAIKLVEAGLSAGVTAEQVATDYAVRDRLIRDADVRPASEDTWATVVILLDWMTSKVRVVTREKFCFHSLILRRGLLYRCTECGTWFDQPRDVEVQEVEL